MKQGKKALSVFPCPSPPLSPPLSLSLVPSLSICPSLFKGSWSRRWSAQTHCSLGHTLIPSLEISIRTHTQSHACNRSEHFELARDLGLRMEMLNLTTLSWKKEKNKALSLMITPSITTSLTNQATPLLHFLAFDFLKPPLIQMQNKTPKNPGVILYLVSWGNPRRVLLQIIHKNWD